MKCRQAALRLIKFRVRSRKELEERLRAKGYSLEVVQDVLAYCQEHRFIDDKAFALIWARGRVKKPFGFSRICRELYNKGIAEDIVSSVIEEIKKDYHEQEAIHNIVCSRLSKYKGLDPLKAKARLFGFLLRRGFSKDLVIEAVSRI
ncbi:MAG: regulatory protein RecX [Candidatus Omnitrophota bacterium]